MWVWSAKGNLVWRYCINLIMYKFVTFSILKLWNEGDFLELTGMNEKGLRKAG